MGLMYNVALVSLCLIAGVLCDPQQSKRSKCPQRAPVKPDIGDNCEWIPVLDKNNCITKYECMPVPPEPCPPAPEFPTEDANCRWLAIRDPNDCVVSWECTPRKSINDDFNPSCCYWAMIGECQTNPAYMMRACGKSCRQCQDPRDPISCESNLKNDGCPFSVLHRRRPFESFQLNRPLHLPPPPQSSTTRVLPPQAPGFLPKSIILSSSLLGQHNSPSSFLTFYPEPQRSPFLNVNAAAASFHHPVPPPLPNSAPLPPAFSPPPPLPNSIPLASNSAAGFHHPHPFGGFGAPPPSPPPPAVIATAAARVALGAAAAQASVPARVQFAPEARPLSAIVTPLLTPLLSNPFPNGRGGRPHVHVPVPVIPSLHPAVPAPPGHFPTVAKAVVPVLPALPPAHAPPPISLPSPPLLPFLSPITAAAPPPSHIPLPQRPLIPAVVLPPAHIPVPSVPSIPKIFLITPPIPTFPIGPPSISLQPLPCQEEDPCYEDEGPEVERIFVPIPVKVPVDPISGQPIGDPAAALLKADFGPLTIGITEKARSALTRSSSEILPGLVQSTRFNRPSPIVLAPPLPKLPVRPPLIISGPTPIIQPSTIIALPKDSNFDALDANGNGKIKEVRKKSSSEGKNQKSKSSGGPLPKKFGIKDYREPDTFADKLSQYGRLHDLPPHLIDAIAELDSRRPAEHKRNGFPAVLGVRLPIDTVEGFGRDENGFALHLPQELINAIRQFKLYQLRPGAVPAPSASTPRPKSSSLSPAPLYRPRRLPIPRPKLSKTKTKAVANKSNRPPVRIPTTKPQPKNKIPRRQTSRPQTPTTKTTRPGTVPPLTFWLGARENPNPPARAYITVGAHGITARPISHYRMMKEMKQKKLNGVESRPSRRGHGRGGRRRSRPSPKSRKSTKPIIDFTTPGPKLSKHRQTSKSSNSQRRNQQRDLNQHRRRKQQKSPSRSRKSSLSSRRASGRKSRLNRRFDRKPTKSDKPFNRSPLKKN